MNDKQDYLMTALDFFLVQGREPSEAWRLALDGYARVFHVDDGRSKIARSAEFILEHIEEPKPK